MATPADPGELRAGDLALWQSRLRAQFPIITGHPRLAYLDSAATAQKPQVVLDAMQAYLTTTNANAGRGTYPWANRTTALLEDARERVKEFLGDPDPRHSEVHFTSGTTQGLRTVALDWMAGYLADGDEIIVPFADHQANLSPWLEAQQMLARQGTRIEIKAMPYQADSGDYDHEGLAAMAGPRTRCVAATHVHHVYGGTMRIERIRKAVGPDVPICLDAAQSVGHLPLSVADLDVDFVVFSGHKAMALPGTGEVWARQSRGPAFRPAGWNGTPNTVGIVTLAAALDWLDAAGTDRIEDWTVALASRLTEGLRRLSAIRILGCQLSLAAGSPVDRRRGIVTFRHLGIPSVDLAFILYDQGIMVRSDGHCQGSAGERSGSVRVSLHVYNTPDEIDRLLAALAALPGDQRTAAST